MLDTKNPGPLATAGASNWYVVLQATPNQIAEKHLELNHFRARHIARRAGLSPIAAGVVAALFYGEARR